MFHKIFSLYEFGALCALKLQCYEICHMGTLQKAKPRKTPLKFFHFPAVSGRPNSARLLFFRLSNRNRLTVAELVGDSDGGFGTNFERGSRCHSEGSYGSATPDGVGIGSEYDSVWRRSEEVVFDGGGEHCRGCWMNSGGRRHCYIYMYLKLTVEIRICCLLF